MSGSTNGTDTAAHTWSFFRAGGFSQVLLSSADDLRRLPELDQKLWVALGCPASGLEFDEKTLALIDTDKDGRVRAPEVLAAVQWVCAMLKDPSSIFNASDSLPLDAITDATPDGKVMLASARQILSGLGKEDAREITIADTTDTARIFAQTRFNGDGIVPADSTDDPHVRQLITEIIDCMGPMIDRSGKPGVDQATLDAFISQARDYSLWWAEAEKNAAAVFPLSKATADAAEALRAVRSKIDDYFARCRLAAFDERALPALNRHKSEYEAIASRDLSIALPEIAAFPLARVKAVQPLPLGDAVNPAWAAAISRFTKLVVTPVLGDRHEISEQEFAGLKARFDPYEAWLAAKSGKSVERLGIDRVRQILSGDGQAALSRLIASDKALEQEVSAISAVDKLVRFHRDLGKLLNNFVSFRDFYQRKDKAIFQVGRLYLDQRSCDLCVRVDDMARHAALAHLSRTYLAYCDCVRKGTGEKMTIAAAFSDGDGDNLIVGRNGIFYDRKGRDWDATIVKIVENPISIRQAFFAPYKRAIRWVEDQIAKRAATAETTATDKLTAMAAKPADHKPKVDLSVIAALGVAVGGVTAALGYLLQAFFGLGAWMPAGVVVLVLSISGPSMVIAWLKLRQRNLGPILDANGWAVNTRARLNIPLGRSLTSVATLPASARLSAVDPFAETKHGRNIAVAVAVLAAVGGLWYTGLFDSLLPARLQRSAWTRKPALSAQVAAPLVDSTGAAPSAVPAAK